jgi:hypothetical protein
MKVFKEENVQRMEKQPKNGKVSIHQDPRCPKA